MFRRLARTLLLLVAVLGLLPGVSEAVEQLGELIEHGHPAHSVPGETDPLAGEHGCTPVQHQCPCHEGQSIALYSYTVGAMTSEHWLTWMMEADRVRVHATSSRTPASNDRLPILGANAPPTPPPNA